MQPCPEFNLDVTIFTGYFGGIRVVEFVGGCGPYWILLERDCKMS